MTISNDYWLTDSLGYWLYRASHAAHHGFDRVLANYGVTAAQWGIMGLSEQHGPMTPTALVTATGIDTGAMARLLQRMVDKGLLQARRNPEDARSKIFTLTARGRRLLPMLKRLSRKANLYITNDMSVDERKKLIDLLRHIEERAVELNSDTVA